MHPTVVLFDIDGTLVTTGGAGRRAIEQAFELVHGRPDACKGIRFGGMTDRNIARLGLEAIGVVAEQGAIDCVLAQYVECLREAVRSVPDEAYRVHLGAREAVEAALAAGMAVGLGTGNVREGARIKLERVGLFEKFAFGGFGDDHELRSELIRRGAERGTEKLLPRPAKRGEVRRRRGEGQTPVRVLVVGDTPKDVAAAQAIGAQSIAVATGGFSVAQLAASGATWVFETLADDGALDALLRGSSFQTPEEGSI